jgi:tetratricopeptide (TPR) repeat protein
MVKEAQRLHAAHRACTRARRAVARGTGVEMTKTRRSPSVSDRTFSWLMRLGVLALAIGVAAFGFMYYQDQHVDAGPSLVDRQIQGAEAAVRKTPGDIEVRLQLAAAYQSNKQNDDALKQYDEILKSQSKNKTALLGRGSALIAEGDLIAASAAYHKITDMAAKGEFAAADPQLEEAHYFLGSIAVKQGKTKEALTELSAALKIDRTDSDALYLLGVAELRNGAAQLAVNALNEALMFVPTGWCEPYTQLGLAYGKLANAPRVTYAAAMADFCHKKPADATRQLKTLVKSPAAVDALLGLGLIAETESAKAEAIDWYKQVITIDAKNSNAISSLSRLGVTGTSTTKK